MTPTPEFGIDMEKFHNFPKSYEYLLAHPDEFVHAPDPLTDRAAFERWWIEEFLQAIGEPSERDVDIWCEGVGPLDGYTAVVDPSRRGRDDIWIGQPDFFYFDHNGEVFPVPVIHLTMDGNESVDMTFAVALYDYDLEYNMSIATSFRVIHGSVDIGDILIDLTDERPGSYTETVRQFIRNNFSILDQYTNRVVFGVGYVRPAKLK
jgi:hypothetical protein